MLPSCLGSVVALDDDTVSKPGLPDLNRECRSHHKLYAFRRSSVVLEPDAGSLRAEPEPPLDAEARPVASP